MVEGGVEFCVEFAEVFDFAAGVHNGCVVTAAEVAAYFLKRVFCKLAGKIHADLSWFGDTLAAFLALQVGEADIEMLRDGFDDIADSYMSCYGINLVAERGLRHFEGDFFAGSH